VLALGVVAGAITLAVTTGSAQQPAEEQPNAPKMAAAPPIPGPPPPAAPVAAKIRDAEPGRQLGHGPAITIDEVELAAAAPPTTQAASTAVRLTITGSFPLRALDPVVLVDNKPVGRGISAVDARSLRVSVQDPSVLKTGAVIAYQYGSGPVTVVGTLAQGVK
jgi:hypothetical protein